MFRLFLPLRFIMLLASLGAIVGALLMFGLGCFKLVGGVPRHRRRARRPCGASPPPSSPPTDAYLFGIVLVIFAYAIAFGFVFDVPAEERAQLPAWMRVGGISELKHTLVEVILVYLVVEFATDVAQAEEHLTWEALIMPIAILLIAGALRCLSVGHAGGGAGTAGAPARRRFTRKERRYPPRSAPPGTPRGRW